MHVHEGIIDMTWIEWLAENGTIIGLLGVTVFVLLEFEHRLPKRLHRILVGANIGLTISAFSLGVLKNKIDAKWQNKMQAQQVEADRKIYDTIRRADELEKSASIQEKQAQKLASELSVSNNKLTQAMQVATAAESKVRPRTISDDQKADFKDVVKNLPLGRVSVRSASNSYEACSYADEIRDLLGKAGYLVSKGENSILLPTPVGVMVQISDPDAVPTHALPLLTALKKINVEASGQRWDGIAKDEVVVVVGDKPQN